MRTVRGADVLAPAVGAGTVHDANVRTPAVKTYLCYLAQGSEGETRASPALCYQRGSVLNAERVQGQFRRGL